MINHERKTKVLSLNKIKLMQRKSVKHLLLHVSIDAIFILNKMNGHFVVLMVDMTKHSNQSHVIKECEISENVCSN